MAPESATARIFLAACLFPLPIFFLSHHVAAATAASPPLSFSFDFSDTSKYRLHELRFEGDAALNGDLVDLTCNSDTFYCSGRMSYNYPVAFYDNNTGEVASFSTTFTFAINLWPNTTKKAEGMTFFLSGYPSRLLPDWSSNALGLTNSTETIPSGEDRFVAVEFDTYGNPWDPTGSTDHIGIDLNSLTSVSAKRLPSYSLNGTMTATITFDNATRTLEATLHFANRSLASATVRTQLLGQLDALLPPVVSVGFSAATGGYSELHQIYSWSFNSTMAAAEIATGFNRVHPEQGGIFGVKGRQGRSLVIGGLVILAFALLLAIWLTLSCWRLKHKWRLIMRPQGRALVIGGAVILTLALLLAIWWILSWYRMKHTYDSLGKDSRVKRFEYSHLSTATKKFSTEIGKGGFGVVYSGSLEKKSVAVKEILKKSRGEFKDFLAELATIDQTSHMNVVRLEGWGCSISNFMFWCFQRQTVKLFLVYELVPNGDLHEHLDNRSEVLSWAMRYKIVKGLCSALHYLHHQCPKYILHRDIKPSNILLDNDFNAKLSDFGLSRAAEESGITLKTSAVGTVLYMDPLCMKDGQVTFRRSSDVYSFGIVLLEIAHGKNDPALFRKLHTIQLPETFVEDVADEKLAGEFDRTQMECVILLGLRCSDPIDEKTRPSMIGAMQFLEKGGELHPATIHEDEQAARTTAPATA